MIFGDDMRAAASTAAADWIGPACVGRPGTVGSLVPNLYEAVLRVQAPPPSPGEWWASYRELYAVVADVGARHTARADRAWFAVWEGHGFATATSHIAWFEPAADEEEQRARDAERARLVEDDRRRNAAIRAGLDAVPRFSLPDRTYHLLEGPLAGVTGLIDPSGDHWRNPDLLWPDDRRWFVATDVDFWSLFIGGEIDLITEIARVAPTPTELVTLDAPLPIED